MGIFSKKTDEAKDTAKKPAAKKTAKKKTVAKKKTSATAIKPQEAALYDALSKPRLTEKAAHMSGDNVYTFDVPMAFNKVQIAQAIDKLYKVAPTKIRTLVRKPKTVRRRGVLGSKSAFKKAMVYLSKGDSITF